jgi:hypothetical protein
VQVWIFQTIRKLLFLGPQVRGVLVDRPSAKIFALGMRMLGIEQMRQICYRKIISKPSKTFRGLYSVPLSAPGFPYCRQ